MLINQSTTSMEVDMKLAGKLSIYPKCLNKILLLFFLTYLIYSRQTNKDGGVVNTQKTATSSTGLGFS